MKQFSSLIERQYQANLPFVVYHEPHHQSVKVCLQQNSKLYHVSNMATDQGFVFSPFNKDQEPIIFPESECQRFQFSFKEFAEHSPKPTTRPNLPVNLAEAEHYQELVKKAVREIEHSSLEKVVTSRPIKLTVEVTDFSALAHRLMHEYPDAMSYIWFHPEVGLWAGASPEIFLKLNRDRLETMALAGTRNASEIEQYPFTTKEFEEQAFVTRHIIGQLSRYCKTVKQSDVQQAKAGSLLHLKTSIKAVVNPEHLGQIIKDLHPTPAVCGLPVKFATQFLEQNEHYEREYYTGFFGELNLKEEKTRSNRRQNTENQVFKSITTSSHLFVNLRCMQLKPHQCVIYVGGGITEKSNPEDEWQETLNKAKTMLNVL